MEKHNWNTALKLLQIRTSEAANILESMSTYYLDGIKETFIQRLTKYQISSTPNLTILVNKLRKNSPEMFIELNNLQKEHLANPQNSSLYTRVKSGVSYLVSSFQSLVFPNQGGTQISQSRTSPHEIEDFKSARGGINFIGEPPVPVSTSIPLYLQPSNITSAPLNSNESNQNPPPPANTSTVAANPQPSPVSQPIPSLLANTSPPQETNPTTQGQAKRIVRIPRKPTSPVVQ